MAAPETPTGCREAPSYREPMPTRARILPPQASLGNMCVSCSQGPDLETLGLPATPTRLHSAHLQGRVLAWEGVPSRPRAASPSPTLHQDLTQLPSPLDRIFVASRLLRRREQSCAVTG